MSFFNNLKLKLDAKATQALLAYAKPNTFFEEGVIGPAEMLAATLLQQAGLSITAEQLDKIVPVVEEAVKGLLAVWTVLEPVLPKPKQVEAVA
jgi:hypothetical protein